MQDILSHYDFPVSLRGDLLTFVTTLTGAILAVADVLGP